MLVERICAWCGKHLGWLEWEKPPDHALPITHSICPECSAKVAQDLEQIQPKKENEK